MARVKPPILSRKTSWPIYQKQLEVAARTNCWTPKEKAVALTVTLQFDTMDVLQTLPLDKVEEYKQLEKQLDVLWMFTSGTGLSDR